MIINDPTNHSEHDEIREVTHEMASRIISLGGTCTGEHGIGMGKIELLVEETGESAVSLMRKIKRTLDPNWILNPGKVLAIE
jgi:D-lactate dehydrogenase (cytochrome)